MIEVLTQKAFDNLDIIFKNDNGETYVPFVRISGAMEESLYKREYYLLSQCPETDCPLLLSQIYKLIKNSKYKYDGVLLMDRFTGSFISITIKELDEYVKKHF